MASHLDLQTQLEELLGTRNVYYQPPESMKLNYPCIIFHLADIDVRSANNKNYITNRSYQLMLIDENEDSEFVDKILNLPKCSFNRQYPSNGLNHFVYTIFY